ncbi:MAG: GTPase/DUF3482 domain-containing protein [Syntrophaceae bacterium]
MTDTPRVLTFAVVGHPNEGKSSVVSTLTEDDSVRITPIPGETLICRAFPVIIDGRELARFVDTPGFQSPHATLEWLQAHPGPDMLRAFIQAHSPDPLFKGECELFKPLVEGSEIIYVLDASRPLRSVDIAEMEILRSTGIPRMAIINNKEEDESYVATWRDELRKHFNAVRIFNAHRATYAERIALLGSLKSIDQEWEASLGQVIKALEEDWHKRITQTAWLITRLTGQALAYQVSRSFPPEQEPHDLLANLTQAYREHITRLERETHLEIRALFKHNIFDYRLPEQCVEGDDLFQERTWRMLGLTPAQVVAAGAVAGSGIGLGIDAAVGGTSLGAFALVGGLLGAGTALLGGKRMITYEIKGPHLGRFRIKKPIGDFLLTVGPNKNTQFPFILLDRALIFVANTINWAHARRNMLAERADNPKGFVTHFSEAQSKVCHSYFQAARANDEVKREAQEELMAQMLTVFLMALSNQDYRTGAPHHPA